MFHLKLCKALSYDGIVSATKKKPDVFVEDEATAKAAVATGYFEIVEEQEAQQEMIAAHLDRGRLEEMKFDDLKALATDMGIDISGLKKKVEVIDAIVAEEVYITAEGENEVDYGDGEDAGAGSPTMIELQK